MNRVSVLIFLILVGCGSHKIANYESNSTEITSEHGDGGLDSLIKPYKASMEAEMSLVIGTSDTLLEKYAPESPLGNFAAEAVYLRGYDFGINTRAFGPNIMKRSFCLLNFGGLRAPINPGEITVGNIYELMPFDNTLTLVTLTPEKARECAQYLFAQHGQPVFNATFMLSSDSESMTIGGEPYQFDENVVVITSDYLASGGDKMDFFKDPIRKYDTGIFIRDIFIEYVKSKKQLGGFPETGKFHFIKN